MYLFLFFSGGGGVSNEDFFFNNYLLFQKSCHQIQVCGTPEQQIMKEYCIGLKT